MTGKTHPLIDRFWKQTQQTDTCWIWTGSINNKGYGKIGIKTQQEAWKSIYAHRAAYELFVGPVPDGLDLDHLCRVTKCVNPKHLEPVTRKENVRRGRNFWSEKTHCPNGHPYEGRNLLMSRRGDGSPFRMCRTCNYQRSKEGNRLRRLREKVMRP